MVDVTLSVLVLANFKGLEIKGKTTPEAVLPSGCGNGGVAGEAIREETFRVSDQNTLSSCFPRGLLLFDKLSVVDLAAFYQSGVASSNVLLLQQCHRDSSFPLLCTSLYISSPDSSAPTLSFITCITTTTTTAMPSERIREQDYAVSQVWSRAARNVREGRADFELQPNPRTPRRDEEHHYTPDYLGAAGQSHLR